MTIDARLADSLRAIDNEKFKCSIPGYSDKKISEIGELLLARGAKTIALKKYYRSYNSKYYCNTIL